MKSRKVLLKLRNNIVVTEKESILPKVNNSIAQNMI